MKKYALPLLLAALAPLSLAQADTGCALEDQKTCLLAQAIASELQAQKGIAFNEAVRLGGATADGKQVRVIMHMHGEILEKVRALTDTNAAAKVNLASSMMEVIETENCREPGVRYFIAMGGSLVYAFVFEEDEADFISMGVSRCPEPMDAET